MRIQSRLVLLLIGYVRGFTITPNQAFSTPLSAKQFSLSSSKLFSTASSEDGHIVTDVGEISDEELAIQKRFMEHQKQAKKLGFPVDVRTLVEYNHGFAALCTNSNSKEGYPSGSVVAFAPDEDGQPLFLFSEMSSHTKNIKEDKRTSMVIAAKEFKGAADGRVSLMGKTSVVSPEESEAVKKIYMKKHPDAFWAEFGDFKWYRMEVEEVNFVGGFARAGSISSEEYREAKPDPISAFGMHVANHMNEDHQSSTIAMIEQQIPGLGVSEALITSVDSLGMYVKVARPLDSENDPQQFKLRLPFPRQAADRKDIKNLIVQMTKEATMASSAEQED